MILVCHPHDDADVQWEVTRASLLRGFRFHNELCFLLSFSLDEISLPLLLAVVTLGFV